MQLPPFAIALVTHCTTDRVQAVSLYLLVHKTFVGHTPDYISDLFTPVADIPTRSSLRASSNGNLFLSRTERLFGDRTFSVALHVCGIGCRQN